MESIFERLAKLVEEKSSSKREFANSIGVPQTTFNTYMNGRSIPTEIIIKILLFYPDVSAEWMMRGEGTMYRKQEYTTNIDLSDNRIQNNSAPVAVGQGNKIVSGQDIESINKTIAKLQKTIEQQQQTISKLVEKL